MSDGAYTAWGGLNSASYPNTPFCWKGQWGAYHDTETGLFMMGAHYYAPAIGRFLSRDPSGFASGPNLYAFCTSDPVNFFDPDGCEAEENEGPFWNGVQTASNVVDFFNKPLELLRMPASNPFATLMRAHDSFRDWGEAEGNTKSSPAKLAWMRAGAATNFAFAALEFGGYGLAATRGLAALRGGCFVAGTPVQTVVMGTNGKFHVLVKPIETMHKGDLVLARNGKTGKTQIRRVLKTTLRDVDKVLTVALADAKTHKVVEKITATREHPFYVEHKGFVPAGGLAVGNAIVTRAGPALVVQSIEWHRRAEGYKVYNFVVEDDHTYFVGKAGGGVWVHNPVGDCTELLARARAARDIAKAFVKTSKGSPGSIIGAFNIETGEIAVGVSGGQDASGSWLCGEDHAVAELGGDITKIGFTEPVRPRVPIGSKDYFMEVFKKCQSRYPDSMFPSGTKFVK